MQEDDFAESSALFGADRSAGIEQMGRSEQGGRAPRSSARRCRLTFGVRAPTRDRVVGANRAGVPEARADGVEGSAREAEVAEPEVVGRAPADQALIGA